MAEHVVEESGIPEVQIQSSLARIESNMTVFAAEQREISSIVKEIRSDLSVRAKFGDIPSSARSSNKLVLHDDLRSGSREAGGLEAVSEESVAKVRFSRQAMEASKSSRTNLDRRWPVTIRRRLIFEDATVGITRSTESFTASLSLSSAHISGIKLADTAEPTTKYVILPASELRSIIDVTGMFFLAWDLLLTPLQLAWNFNIEGWLLILSLFVSSFWTLDMVFSFRTAYYTKNGDLETRPFQIALHYMKRQFAVDLLILMCDWVNLLAGFIPSFVTLLRALKVTRIVRLARVARLISHETFDKLTSSFGLGPTVFESIKIIVFCIWLTHVISCGWFAIGNLNSSDTGMHWIDSSWGFGSTRFKDADIGFQYSSALQWTLTTMVSGTSVILPLNSLEQVFSCWCILVGLLGQAFAISILSSSVIERKSRQQYLSATVASLQKFCVRHKVDQQLALTARSQVRASIVQSSLALQLDQVEGLQITSTKIRKEILREVFEPHLSHHSLFLLCSQVDRHTFSKLTNDCMDLTYVQSGHDIFMAGDTANRMYLLSKGEATYVQDPESSKEPVSRSVEVSLDVWCCEPALWTHWTYVGTMEAISKDCEVLVLEVACFHEIMHTSGKLKPVMNDYAVSYHKRISESVPPTIFWPTDVETHGTSFAHILCSMPAAARKTVDTLTFEYAQSSQLLLHLNQNQLAVLMEEVRDGRANLVLSKAQSSVSVGRTVSVVRVCLCKDDQDMFVELGRLQHDGIVAVNCDFPGAYQRQSEDVISTLARVVDGIKPTVGDMELINIKIDENLQHSKAGVSTYHVNFIAYYRTTADVISPKANRSTECIQLPRMRTLSSVKNETRKDAATLLQSVSQLSLRDFGAFMGRSEYVLAHAAEVMKMDLFRKLVDERKLHAVRTDDEATLICAWLSQAEVDFLRTRKGVDFLEDLFEDEDVVAHLTSASQYEIGISPSHILEEVAGDDGDSLSARSDELAVAPVRTCSSTFIGVTSSRTDRQTLGSQLGSCTMEANLSAYSGPYQTEMSLMDVGES